MAYTTIDDPSAHFQALTYTGNATNRTLTFDGNSDLQADWFWFKERNASANWHQLYDTSRGIGTSSSKRLFTNATSAEEETSGSGVRGVGTNSVDIGTTPGVNGNTNTLVLWAWKANGGTTSSNTDGDITSTVQVNSTSKFSIFTYTGNGNNLDTVGHGLGTTPDFCVIKGRSSGASGTQRWFVKVPAVCGASEILELDTTNAKGDSGNGIETMSSTTVTLGIDTGNGNGVNESGLNYVGYAFASVEGYSKIGSYTGNGNADGPFVYTGFRPAWVMTKRTDSTSSWFILDVKRDPENYLGQNLYPNLANAESTETSGRISDFLSNGFKCRGSNNDNNASGGTYIYMAFAEHPFVSSKGVPVTAR